MTESSQRILPYGRHSIDESDISAVVSVLRSDCLTSGPVTEQFESEFAKKVGAKHAVVCSSGTAALHMASVALGLGSDDCVIVPTLTFLATANAPHYTGAKIIFADVDADTGLMTEATFLDALKRADKHVKAVFPVHLNGACVDMVNVSHLARKHGIKIVEDACHALGAKYNNGVLVGSCVHSDMAIFSLHPVKNIAMGEGGVVTTNDVEIYKDLLRLRNHGMIRDPADFELYDEGFSKDGKCNTWYYEMQKMGFNYRASEIHCALGLSQLEKLEKFLFRRREIVAIYDEAFSEAPEFISPVKKVEGCQSGLHLYVLHLNFNLIKTERVDVMNTLCECGVGTQVHYFPVHLQPYYRKCYGHYSLPGSEKYYSTALSLPLYPAMTDRDVQLVVDCINSI